MEKIVTCPYCNHDITSEDLEKRREEQLEREFESSVQFQESGISQVQRKGVLKMFAILGLVLGLSGVFCNFLVNFLTRHSNLTEDVSFIVGFLITIGLFLILFFFVLIWLLALDLSRPDLQLSFEKYRILFEEFKRKQSNSSVPAQ